MIANDLFASPGPRSVPCSHQLLLSLLTLALLGFSACTGAPDNPPSLTTSDPAPSSQSDDNPVPTTRYGPAGPALLIGIIAERTGPAGPQNQPVFAATRFAVDRINRAGGLLGQAVALMEYDNRTQPLIAAAAARQAVQDGVIAVIGSARSSNSMAMAPILQEAEIVMISPESTNPAVTQVGSYIFRACFTDDFQSEVLAAFAREHLQASTAVTLTCAGRLYSRGISQRFASAFTARGGRLLWDGPYLESDANFDDLIARLRDAQPDIVVIPGEVRDSGLIIRQAHTAGLDCTWLGPDSWNGELFDVAGIAAEGAYFSSHWHRDSDLPASRAFVATYEAEVEPIRRAGLAMFHDATMLLADAITRAGSSESGAIRAALSATSEFSGISGPIRFNSNGDPIAKPAVIMQLRDGQAHFVITQQP